MGELATPLPCRSACFCLQPRRTWGRRLTLPLWRLISGSEWKPSRRRSSRLTRMGAMQTSAARCRGISSSTLTPGCWSAKAGHVTPLAIRLENEIPLGMGCGSSAAAVLASVAMAVLLWRSRLGRRANRFRSLGVEGHPDNVAACWHGGVVLARTPPAVRNESVSAVSVVPIPVAVKWPLLACDSREPAGNVGGPASPASPL